jgi:hypothetical protein
MDRKVILTSFIAFCAALGLGRLVFNAQAPQASSGAEQVSSKAIPVSTPTKSSEELQRERSSYFDSLPKGADLRKFTNAGDAVVNKGRQMTHELSKSYLGGQTATYPGMMNGMFHWMPKSQDLLHGNQPVAVNAAKELRGELDREDTENRFVYANTYPNTDEVYYINHDGSIEHDIRLTMPLKNIDETCTLIYKGHVQVSPGLTFWDGQTKIASSHYVTSHPIHVKNQFNNVVFELRRPFAYDANVTTSEGKFDKRKQADGKMQHCETPCQYVLDFDQDGITLGIATPGQWLSDSRRAYPVTIDPNLGQFGLADGTPPIYVGSVGTAPIIPAHAGGQRMVIEENCPDPSRANQSYGHIPMPFDFTYYGQVYPAGSFLFVHMDGWAGFDPPYQKYNINPIHSPCFDVPNNPIPTPPPGFAYFAPYWADLKFKDLSGATTNIGLGGSGNNDSSGIYFYTDGIAPSRNLNIEWHKMTYVHSSDANQVISFNLVLHECDSQIQFIIGQEGDTDLGLASVGIQDPSGSIGIQYCFNSFINGQIPSTNANNNNSNNPFGGNPNPTSSTPNFGNTPTGNGSSGSSTIQPGTSLSFSLSPISRIRVLNSALSGCAPLTVCFSAQVDTRLPDCEKVLNQPAQPPGFGFHWTFGDASPLPSNGLPIPGGSGGEAFTATTCHIFSSSGVFSVQLAVEDTFGHVTPYGGTLTVQVCEVPTVVVTSTPQGGPAPLEVDFEARTPTNQNLQIASSTWQIDQLGYNNDPGEFQTVATIPGAPGPLASTSFSSSVAHYRFDVPSLYKTTVVFTALDVGSGLATSGIGTVFNFVTDPNTAVQDQLIVTRSAFNIDWTGKLSRLAPLDTLHPRNPNNDTMTVAGIINLPDHVLSDLGGHTVRVVLNGTVPLFVGTMDANGQSIQGDASTGVTGNFRMTLPSGAFQMNVRNNLSGGLGLPTLNGDVSNNGNANLTVKNQTKTTARRVASAFHIEIDGGLYSSPPVVVTHAYSSRFIDKQLTNVASTATSTATGVGTGVNVGVLIPPPEFVGGKGVGTYNLGGAFKNIGRIGVHTVNGNGFQTATVPNVGVGAPVAKEEQITGGFVITDALVTLQGKDLFANLSGILIRPGGGSFRPTPTSDVILTLNAASNPAGVGFRQALNFGTTVGFKARGSTFTYKAPAGTNTGIANLQWSDGIGRFLFKSFALDNTLVGLDPTRTMQTLVLGFTLTPDSGTTVIGSTRFTVTKTTDKKGGDAYVKSTR